MVRPVWFRGAAAGAAGVAILVSSIACRPNEALHSEEREAEDVLTSAGYDVIDVIVDWPEDGVTTVVLGGDADPASAARLVWRQISLKEATLRIWVGESVTELHRDQF